MEFAAHIREEDNLVQTVKEHCSNTAELCGKYCSLFGAENIGHLQGIMHDAGKLTPEFNDYIRRKSNAKRGDVDHSYAGAKYITEMFGEEYKNLSLLISHTIISHHGLHDWVDSNCEDYFKKRILTDQNYKSVVENIESIISKNKLSELVKKANEEYKAIRKKIYSLSKNKEVFAFYLGSFERLLQSALIAADRKDTADFMTGDLFDEEIDEEKLWDSMQERLNNKLQLFADKKDSISLQRKSISDRCAGFAKNKVGVCKLIVPTGGGKTLSSLRFAIEYCKEHSMKKIIYTAPFMSILEQNSDEIRGVAGDRAFTEHHSNVVADFDFGEDSDECRKYELHAERWDSPVIATTMVQFLNTLFSSKTSCVRRMHQLCKAVIIIDEVQSIPLKCVNLFNLAVNFLSNICGATVVLCSATQPVSEETKYPMIIDEKSSMTGDYKQDFEVFKRTEIISAITPFGFSFDEAANFCFEKFSEEGNLLLIVNTKSSALKMFELMKAKCDANTEIIHLSTNMCPQHRRDKIKLIRMRLSEKKPVICITTQLIEAGVDISFGCVVRSCAGLDNAVQAAGRCNRHGEAGKICPVYLINLRDEKLLCLREISVSKGITEHMIDSGRFDDLQSVDTVSEYFRILYKSEKDKLSYNLTDNDKPSTMIDLLSLNKERYEVSKKTSDPLCSQAFATAGRLFEVIDSNTIDVIVPYDSDAENIINSLNKPYQSYRQLLKSAQKYIVSVYSGTEKKLLENNALYMTQSGAVTLEKAFYDDKIGVNLENKEHELLMF